MNKPALVLTTVYFDESDREHAAKLGSDLYGLLTRPVDNPLAHGSGILVYQAMDPQFVDCGTAENLVVLPVLGKEAHLLQDTREAVLAAIREWQARLGPGHVIPVPVSSQWRTLENDLPGQSHLTELYGQESRPRRTLDEIVLATLRLLDPDLTRVPLFISNTRADPKSTDAEPDLRSNDDAAKAIRNAVAGEDTWNAFFKVEDLAAKRLLEGQLHEFLRGGIFVSIRNDAFSSQDRCQKELLIAKQNGLPTLTVEILKKGENLSSAYGGNGPTMRWDGDPGAVVSRAMVECLRAAHFRRETERTIPAAGLPADSLALCRPPELLDLVQGPVRQQGAQVVIHPDPELPAAHRDLLSVANPRLQLVTPSTAYRRIGKASRSVANPFDGQQIALSLSDSPSVDGPEGFSKHHVKDATVYLARCLIAAGAHIAYGGDFRKGGYTEILANLISAYRQTAGGDAILHSYLGAPICLSEAPDDLPITAHHMGRHPFKESSVLPPWNPSDPDEPLKPLYYSEMRLVMAQRTQARVVLGGASVPRLEETPGHGGYGGRYPGVVEESWRSLQARQPLYVVGGFGGAAGLVADLVEGKATPEDLQDANWMRHDTFKTRAATLDHSPYRKALGLPQTLDDLAQAIRELSAGLLESDAASLAWNGLTVDQNRELLRTRDPVAISSLVFNGLLNVHRQDREGKLEVELVDGTITAAQDIDSVAIGVFDDLPLGGAGAALDRVVAGRARLARAGGQELIGLESGEIAADWLYLASLGSFKDLDDLPARVERAGRRTAEQARRHGFSRLGIVAFGGTMVDNLRETTKALINGLAGLAGATTIVWLENDAHRFKMLLEILKQDDRLNVTTRRYSEEATPAPQAVQEQLFLSVRLSNDQLSSTAMPPSGTGLARTKTTPLSEADLRAYSKGGPGRRCPNAGILEERGAQLAKLLIGDDADDLLTRCRDAKVTLIHDIRSSQLPFETLLAKDAEGAIRPAARGGINRRLEIPGVRLEQLLAKPPHTGKLRVLLVVNPLSDLEEAEEEGKAVQESLGDSEGIELLELWNKEATRDAFLDRIALADVLHYCGHAFYDGPGEEESGLNLYGPPLFFTDLKDIDFSVRLVFANACESGRVRAKEPTEVPESASFAEFFLRSGVEAYLGTYWKVGDESAARFASGVYASLAGGDTLDEAVRKGRERLLNAGRDEWANYILYGEGRFQLVRSG